MLLGLIFNFTYPVDSYLNKLFSKYALAVWLPYLEGGQCFLNRKIRFVDNRLFYLPNSS